MTVRLCVVSPRVSELQAALAPHLPAGIDVAYFADADAVAGEFLDAELAFGAPDALAALLPRMPGLRWVQSTWAGVKPLIDAPRRDYQLTGVKGIFGRAMSEYVLGWLLALRRGIIGHATRRSWQGTPEPGLSSLRVGIAGVGSIGAAVATSLAPFVEEARGLNSDGRAAPGCARCFPMTERQAFARGLDALVMLLPHTADTDGLVDADVLDALAPGAVLINAGRANSLAMPAALAALESGRLSACVLDVFSEEPLADEDPLWRVPGLYITSHTAAPTGTAAISAVFLDNLRRYLDGRPLQGLVDFDRGY